MGDSKENKGRKGRKRGEKKVVKKNKFFRKTQLTKARKVREKSGWAKGNKAISYGGTNQPESYENRRHGESLECL